MNSLDSDYIKSLSIEKLVALMDSRILQISRERFSGLPAEYFPKELRYVSQLINTKKVINLSNNLRIQIAWLAFSYLIQNELNQVGIGLVQFVPDNIKPWLYPSYHLCHEVTRQHTIAYSRAVIEIFIDLLYCIENGHSICDSQSKFKPTKQKSKLNQFRQWLCDSSNPFCYFAHVLEIVYQYDAKLRKSEIHGRAAIAEKILLLQKHDPLSSNKTLEIHNYLLNCWNPLIELLNYQRPIFMFGARNGWFKVYTSGSQEEIDKKLHEMSENMKTQREAVDDKGAL